MKKVEVFTSTGCSNCPTMIAIVKHIVGEENTQVTNIQTDPTAMDRLVEPSTGTPIREVPTVILDGEVYSMKNVRKLELKLYELKKG